MTMSRLGVALATALGVVLCALPAAAQTAGRNFYIAADFGPSWYQRSTNTGRFDHPMEYARSALLQFAAGYEWASGKRAELSAGYSKADVKLLGGEAATGSVS